jgi:hypothetical protein
MMIFRGKTSRRLSAQSGQTFLFIILFIGIFLIGVLGIATDYTQIWARRQMTQAAADAACQAGAADLFLQYQDPSAVTAYGIDFSWIGSTFDCSSYATSPPCRYAALNGYSGSKVSVSFPTSLTTASAPSGFGTIANPFIRVKITDSVPLSFTKMFSSTGAVSISASAGCGLNPVAVPIPLVILHRSDPSSLSTQGNTTIQIFGGPNRSIQVDSSSSTAVNVGGGSSIDLSAAGPNGTGADFGVLGNELKPSGVNIGTSGKWISPATPYGDPWISVATPSRPGTAGAAKPVIHTRNGCSDSSGCIEYSGGDYTSCSTGSIAYGANGCLVIGSGGGSNSFSTPPNRVVSAHYTVGSAIMPTNNNAGGVTFEAITAGNASATANTAVIWPQSPVLVATLVDGGVTWLNVGVPPSGSNTAIFDPGLYYLGDSNGLELTAKSMVRPSTATGDGSQGTTFYFATTLTFSVGSNSGGESIDVYHPDGSTNGGVTSAALQCTGGVAIPSQVPTTLSGNVLLGPCTGTYGSSDGKNRGFLFFSNRSVAASPTWSGGGQFLLSGFMYFHKGSGATCGTDTSCFSFGGNSGAGAYSLGNIVADKASLGGTSGIKMILNPASTFRVLRPQLLE